jgi:hypothetical protein
MPPEAFSPLADGLALQIEAGGNDIIGHTLGGEQDQFRTDHVSIRRRIPPRPFLEFLSLRAG